MPPSDALHDIRTEMMLTMIECGLTIEAQHHEVATGGQGEIDMRFAPLVEMADNVLKYKYIVKNVAKKHGKTATFMPKPLFMDNGTGMHVHTSLWKNGVNLFAGSGYAGLSRHGPVRHRRPAQARPGPVRHHQPDDQQLQAAGARLRGAGQPRLQPPQPLGVDPHPGVLAEPQGQAHRVPLPRRLEQSRTWPSRRC